MPVKIAIIGLDALGQSLALALQGSGAEVTVAAHDRTVEVMRTLEKEVPYKVEFNLIAAVEGASVIFLNEPLHVANETLGILARELRSEAVVAGTAAYLQAQAEWATEILPPHLFYVGATPLVGLTQPRRGAFAGQKVAVVPLPDTPENALRLLTEVITILEAEPLYMELVEHDALLAVLYQLPIATSTALMRVAAGSPSWRELAQMAAAPFYAATAFPIEDAAALTALLRYGREPLLRWLGSLEAEISQLRRLLEEEDSAALQSHVSDAVEMGRRWKMKTDDESVEKALEEARKEATAGAGFRRLLGFGRK